MGRISAWVTIAVCTVGLGFSGCGSDDAPGTQADGGLTDAGSVDAGVDGGVTPPATLTVQGSLVDEHGKPVSGWVALNRDFEHAKTVGADGLFSFTGVEAPYDLEASDGQEVLELTRLHRADPRVPLQLQVSHSAVVSGQLVSDYGDTSPAAGHSIYLAHTGGTFERSRLINFTFTQTLHWMGPTPATGELVALDVDLSGSAPSFARAGVLSGVTLAEGAALTDQTVVFDNESPVLTSPTQISADFGAYSTGTLVSLDSVTVQGAQVGLSVPLPLDTLFELPQEGARVQVGGFDAQGRIGAVGKKIVPGQLNSLSLAGLGAISTGAPADAATGIARTPTLQWTSSAPAELLMVSVIDTTTSDPAFIVLLPGDATELAVPLSESLGFGLKPDTHYLWTVAGVHQAGLDSDRVTDPSNDLGILGLLLVSDDVSTVSSGNKTFTTAP